MTPEHLPMLLAFPRGEILSEELALAVVTYEHVLARNNGKTPLDPPTMDTLVQDGESVYSWAEIRGISAQELLDRMVHHSGLPIVPMSTAQPTGESRALTKRIKERVGAPVSAPLPWLPFDVIGPFLVVGHFCPYSQNLGGLPEDLLIKVLLTRSDYERLHRSLEIADLMRTPRTRPGPAVTAAPTDLDSWLLRVLVAGCHADAENLDQMSEEDAISRLRGDTALMNAVRHRLDGIRMIPTAAMMPATSAFDLLPRKLSHSMPALCYYATGQTRHVLIADQSNEGSLQDELTQMGGERVRVVAAQADETEIRRLIDQLSGRSVLTIEGNVESSFVEQDRTLVYDPAELAEMTDDRIKKLLNDEQATRIIGVTFIYRAVLKRSSDIHWEPVDGGLRIRERVNGELRDMATLPGEIGPRLLASLKGAAKMNPSERRLPQDGKMLLVLGSARIEIRMSTVPVRGIESLVMRLKNRNAHRLTVETMQLPDYSRSILVEGMMAPNGIIAICGPTGSGKTTTIDAIIHYLNSVGVAIVTMEDPVEIVGNGLKQIEIRDDIGLTFMRAYRSALRQDPDIMLIGEVRDEASARAALTAANSGHLVFCSMHTNDAPMAFQRFRTYGLSAEEISSSVILAQAQSLVRTLCSCATRRAITEQERRLFRQAGIPESEIPANVMQDNGCQHCGGTGYSGQRAVMEFVPRTPEMQELLSRGPSYREVRALAEEYGYRPLFSEAMALAAAHITTVRECVDARTPYLHLPRRRRFSPEAAALEDHA